MVSPASLLRSRLDSLVPLIADHLHREFPHKPGHVWADPAEVLRPRRAAPAFFGSFDWHSSVHSHWALARALRLEPGAGWADEVSAALDRSLAAEALRAELAALAPEHRRGFEMPYGVAWLLGLGAEVEGLGARQWSAALAPLVELAASRLSAWLDRLPAPIRSGEHSSSAFAMALAHDAAAALGRAALSAGIERRARDFYAGDRDAPLDYEPSAFDFVSPTLAEAALMLRVLGEGFAPWLERFAPRLALEPVEPADRVDGKLAHWDGLNLSRAWMLAEIAAALGQRGAALEAMALRHARAGLAGIEAASYAGTHWLGSFAIRLAGAPGSTPGA